MSSLSVRLTTVLQSAFEGTIFTADPLTNLIAITTTSPPPTPASSSQTPLPGDYRVIPISKLQSFQLLALAPDSSASTTTSPSQDAGNVDASSALKRIDWNALKARERAAVEKELKKKHSRGPGVGKEAQDIFDALSRTYVFTSYGHVCILCFGMVLKSMHEYQLISHVLTGR